MKNLDDVLYSITCVNFGTPFYIIYIIVTKNGKGIGIGSFAIKDRRKKKGRRDRRNGNVQLSSPVAR